MEKADAAITDPASVAENAAAEGGKIETKPKKPTISRQIVRWLLVSVLTAFVIALALIYALFTWRSLRETETLLRLNIEGIIGDMEQQKIWISDYAVTVAGSARQIDLSDPISPEAHEQLTRILYQRLNLGEDIGEAEEWNAVDPGGTIIASTVPELVGFNLNSTGASRAFLEGVREEGAYTAEDFSPGYSDPGVPVLYSGAEIKDGYVVQMGMTRDVYVNHMIWAMEYSLDREYIGQNGLIMSGIPDGTIIACTEGRYRGQKLDSSVFPLDLDEMEPGHLYRTSVEGVDSYVMMLWEPMGDFCGIGVYPVSEALVSRNTTVAAVAVLVTLILTMLFFMLVALMRRTVVVGITKIAGSLSRITDGNLEEKVDVRSVEEFDSLSDDINSTVNTLKRLIAEAAARIDAELAYAKQIQFSSLPSNFPAFPQCPQFDIYARMDTAKEVGGDFYDFYLLDGDRLAFLIADVSGKGIPAALFMMTAKTMIKNLAEENHPVNEIFTLANQRLCESNEAGMFVTAWMCILNYRTGQAEYANAGHNFPVLRHKDGTFSFLKSRAGFVLAGLETVRYRKNEITFEPGDEIYLYTDGVTEATDAHEELYGDDRLIEAVNHISYEDARGLCDGVKESVDAFVGDAPQFDDITMVCMRYLGEEPATGEA